MNYDTLFPLPAPSLHGYAAWEARHKIATHRLEGIASEYDDGVSPWFAFIASEGFTHESQCGLGDTRDEAIADLCRKRNIPLYGAEEITTTKREGSTDGE